MLQQREEDLGEPVIEPPEHDTALFPRVRYLIWTESMINIGCHYGPGDLTPETWDQLLTLNLERSFVDRLVQHRRDTKQEDEVNVGKARAQTGIPGPGGNIFTPSKPYR